MAKASGYLCARVAKVRRNEVSMPIDEHNLAYAPPDAGILPSRKRRELFPRPSALAGALLLARSLIHGAMALVRYASLGETAGWPTVLENSALAVVGIGLMLSNRRYLPQLALALLAIDAVLSNPFSGRIEHLGMSVALATLMWLALAIGVLVALLPFPLLLLGRPTPLRRRFALGIFAVYALFMVSASIVTVESSVFVKNHPPGSLSP